MNFFDKEILYCTVFTDKPGKIIIKTKCIYNISQRYNCDKCQLNRYYRGCIVNHINEICINKYFIKI